MQGSVFMVRGLGLRLLPPPKLATGAGASGAWPGVWVLDKSLHWIWDIGFSI